MRRHVLRQEKAEKGGRWLLMDKDEPVDEIVDLLREAKP
jgi:hypothetical protein